MVGGARISNLESRAEATLCLRITHAYATWNIGSIKVWFKATFCILTSTQCIMYHMWLELNKESCYGSSSNKFPPTLALPV